MQYKIRPNSHVPIRLDAHPLLGLAAAETDIVTFLAARKSGKEIFAPHLLDDLGAVFAVCASLGSLLAAALFDSAALVSFT